MAKRKHQQPVESKPVTIDDPFKHMRDMGLNFIRLGMAMIDPDADIRSLSNAALMCGLKMKFNIIDPPDSDNTPAR